MSKTKKTIAVQFRAVLQNERDPLFNTTHFRFDSYDQLTGEFSGASNLYAISAVYTDPVFDLVSGVINVDVGVAFCNGDNFDRNEGASRAYNSLMMRDQSRYMRLAFRVDPDVHPEMKAHAIASDWHKKLLKPEGRREVHAKIRDTIERIVASSMLPHKLRHALRDGVIRPKKCRGCGGCGSANEGLPKAVRDILEGLGLNASNVQVVKVA